MDISISATIDRQLLNQGIKEFESKERDYSHFHPSQWAKCHRQIAYHYYHAKGLINVDRSSLSGVIQAQTQRIFGNGHYMHDRWRSYLEKTGTILGRWQCDNCSTIVGESDKLGVLKPDICQVCEKGSLKYQEVGFYDEETWWGGHVDAIIDVDLFKKYTLDLFTNNGKNENEIAGMQTTGVEDKYLIIDFKTINPRQFKDLNGPLPDHIVQMQIYLYLSGLKYGKFLYEDKWTQSIKEYLVVRDDNFLSVEKEKALKLKMVLTHTDSNGRPNLLPKRAYTSRTETECLRCKFRGHCWKE